MRLAYPYFLVGTGSFPHVLDQLTPHPELATRGEAPRESMS